MSDDAARAAAIRAKVRAHLPTLRADLERLVRIPSVSFPGRDASQLQRSARAVAEILTAAGAKTRILDLPGAHPAVLGEVAGPPGSPRVLLYAHHDVQPEGPADKWQSPPFEPTERDGRLYGRGTADDKAGILAHTAALLAWGGKPPVNVVVFVEGEEEAGSEHLRAFLEQERETLRCDVAVLADAANWRLGRPSITVSLRGLVNVFVEVRTADHAVHSGMYGGPLPDALTALTRLMATLHDANGDVRVPLHAADADPLDLTETELRGYVGARPGVRAIGSGSLTARLWRRPAASVIGIDAPTVREASNTLIPIARAKVSLRIPPGQDAHAAFEALRAHLMREAPAATWGADVTVTLDHLGQPFETAAKTPAFEAFRRAAGAAWGTPVLDVGMGGSIPFLADFAEVFPDASLLVTGVEDPESNAHSENESLHLGEFENACVAEALFLELLARG